MSHSFKKQVQLIFNNFCYKAFGEVPELTPVTCKFDKNGKYKVPIARDMYQFYRVEGFRYSDPGTTTGILAEQISVHLPKNGGFQWEIDHFGYFIVTPTQQYLQKIKNSEQFTFLPLPCFDQFHQHSKLTHSFDFYFHKEANIGDYCRFKEMERVAKIKQLLNGQQVERNLFYDFSIDQKKIEVLKEQLFSSHKSIILKNIKNFNKRGILSAKKYFSCCPSTKIYYSNNLPHYTLICPYLEYDNETSIFSLSEFELKEQINKSLMKNMTSNLKIDDEWKEIKDDRLFLLVVGDLLQDLNFKPLLGLLKFLEEKKDMDVQVLKQIRKIISILY